MMDTTQIIVAFLIAGALGALIGLERQVGHDEPAEYAGLRTFALYGAWGAGAGFFGDRFGTSAFVVAAAGFSGLILAEYWAATRDGEETGTTTEAASFAAFVIGALVWSGQELAALALAIGVAFLLQSKSWIHGVVSRFAEDDLAAVLRFGVLSGIVLPLLPNRDMGPFGGFNPFEIWLMVVFVGAIGLAGYVALRLLGPRGLAPTGLLGGLISSTAVTLEFSRMSRRQRGLSTALTAGVLAASGLMYGRVLVEAAVVGPELAWRLAAPMIGLFVFVEGVAVWWWTRTGRDDRMDGSAFEVRNPVTMRSALQFGALYGVVAFVAKVAVDRTSPASLNVVGAVSGINDVDAITLTVANLVRDGHVSDIAGARVVLAAVAVNTLVKAVLAIAIGGKSMAVRAGSVLGVAAALGVAVWLVM